jgi:hypothetical protein
MLYRIGFLGCRAAGTTRMVFAQDEPDHLEQVSSLGRADTFSVHPAFRQALAIHYDRDLDSASSPDK